jgi:hypothetical protein
MKEPSWHGSLEEEEEEGNQSSYVIEIMAEVSYC